MQACCVASKDEHMSDQSNDRAVSQAEQPVQGMADAQATMATATSGEPETKSQVGFLL